VTREVKDHKVHKEIVVLRVLLELRVFKDHRGLVVLKETKETKETKVIMESRESKETQVFRV